MEEERLREVLDALYPGGVFNLERTATGHYGGFVISPNFHGQSQIDRQNQLWAGLRQHLQPHELVRIVSLLTLTPEEADVDGD